MPKNNTAINGSSNAREVYRPCHSLCPTLHRDILGMSSPLYFLWEGRPRLTHVREYSRDSYSISSGVSVTEHLQQFNLHRHSIDGQGNDLALAEKLSIGKLYKPELG